MLKADDIHATAKQVMTKAQTMAPARAARRVWGDRKVYIAAVYAALETKLTPAEFKAALAELHAAGGVNLSRADMQDEMPRDIVAASEIRYGNGAGDTWHFVYVD
jgi:hypothetical protein